VTIVSANTRAIVAGAPLALATDTFAIAGCPFQIPVGLGMVPSPCVRVQWVTTDMRTSVNGMPTLSTSSVGLCLAATQLPQGPVIVVSAQPQASSQ
jgi:hypothetical protein